jgi:NAD+ synthase (glutamine-hydrolysing)
MSFFNLYQHNFVRVAVAIPEVRVAEPVFNATQTIALMRKAAQEKSVLVVFPELGLTGYSCEDLFHQQALLDAAQAALAEVVRASRGLEIAAVVGLPIRIDGLLYNCAAVVAKGTVLGVVPKTYLPNYQEFYEMRQFTPGDYLRRDSIDLIGQKDVPIGSHLVFPFRDQPLAVLHVEICEDVWAPMPPSSYGALAGATILANLSGSPVTIGKDAYRRQLVSNQSGRFVSAYLYSGAGFGESTTEVAWDGHGLIYENGSLVAESERFAYHAQLITGEIDLDRLVQDRMRYTTFGQSVQREAASIARFRRVEIPVALPNAADLPLARHYARFPYVPSAAAERDARCREVYEIQVQGLVKRLRAMRAERVVIGISGGLDSTQAVLVCAQAMDRMGLPRKNILAFTMPGFATSKRTLKQAHALMAAMGTTSAEIDIKPSCMQMLKDIGHPYATGKPVYDITFENVQAGERTSHLFRLANHHNAPVIGTGDLSEIALGWSTYGVGDQMSHYNVNASVPKTLIQYLIGYIAHGGIMGGAVSKVLLDVLTTEISPELVPGSKGGQPTQSTQAVVGPYELQDFHLYYILRYGYTPTKVAFLSWSAWRDTSRGTWPDDASEKHAYTIGEVKRWLGVFLKRFFQTSQYKRTAMPNGPKIGSGGSLSPRGDYRAPSDNDATVWLADLERVPDTQPKVGATRAKPAPKKGARK